jgi:hypothetical protein
MYIFKLKIVSQAIFSAWGPLNDGGHFFITEPHRQVEMLYLHNSKYKSVFLIHFYD